MKNNTNGLLETLMSFGAGMFVVAIPLLFKFGFFDTANEIVGLFILGISIVFFVGFLITLIYHIWCCFESRSVK